MLKIRKKYSPGTYSYDNIYNEIRWDLVSCNLKCLFCWSPASRPDETKDEYLYKSSSDVINETIKKINALGNDKIFIRFTGGEPTLYWDDLCTILTYFDSDDQINKFPILIQTNGIIIGQGLNLQPLLNF